MKKYEVTLLKELSEGLYQIELNNKFGFVYPAKNAEQAIEHSKIYLQAKEKIVIEYRAKD